MTRKPVMHLLITDKCDRDCKWCCNKQYDVNDIPVATKGEYESVNTVCLTGGEPIEDQMELKQLRNELVQRKKISFEELAEEKEK